MGGGGGLGEPSVHVLCCLLSLKKVTRLHHNNIEVATSSLAANNNINRHIINHFIGLLCLFSAVCKIEPVEYLSHIKHWMPV